MIHNKTLRLLLIHVPDPNLLISLNHLLGKGLVVAKHESVAHQLLNLIKKMEIR